MLQADDPSPGLWLIAQTRLAEEFLPELNAMELEQDPIHRHKDVLAHTIAVVAKTSPRLKLRLAALLHDVGKPNTRGYGPQGVTFHYHDVVGARMARKRLLALRFPNDVVDDVTRLVELHLRFHTYRMGWTDSAVRRYVRDAGPLLDDLNELTRCDCTTRNAQKAKALARRMDELESRIAELREKEELAKIRPALDGNAVMRVLGVGPGPVVGEALTFLLEIRLDEGEIFGRGGRGTAWAGRASEIPSADSDAFLAGPPQDGGGARRAGRTSAALGLEQDVDPVARPVQRGEDIGDRARPQLERLAVAFVMIGDVEVGAAHLERAEWEAPGLVLSSEREPHRMVVREQERGPRAGHGVPDGGAGRRLRSRAGPRSRARGRPSRRGGMRGRPRRLRATRR
jgi:putative nucleotidyltransferase with HDIG domain